MNDKSFEETVIEAMRAMYILLQEAIKELQFVNGTMTALKETAEGSSKQIRDIQSRIFELSAHEIDRMDFRCRVQSDVHNIMNNTAIIRREAFVNNVKEEKAEEE